MIFQVNNTKKGSNTFKYLKCPAVIYLFKINVETLEEGVKYIQS